MRGRQKAGQSLCRVNAKTLLQGVKDAGRIRCKLLEPGSPAANRGFVRLNRQAPVRLGDGLLNGGDLKVLLGNEKIREFVVDVFAVAASETPDDEPACFIGGSPDAFSGSIGSQDAVAVRARDRFRASYEKDFSLSGLCSSLYFVTITIIPFHIGGERGGLNGRLFRLPLRFDCRPC
jgi:hypothetical protein